MLKPIQVEVQVQGIAIDPFKFLIHPAEGIAYLLLYFRTFSVSFYLTDLIENHCGKEA